MVNVNETACWPIIEIQEEKEEENLVSGSGAVITEPLEENQQHSCNQGYRPHYFWFFRW